MTSLSQLQKEEAQLKITVSGAEAERSRLKERCAAEEAKCSHLESELAWLRQQLEASKKETTEAVAAVQFHSDQVG